MHCEPKIKTEIGVWYRSSTIYLFNRSCSITVFSPSEAVEVTCGKQRFNSLVPDSWTCCAGKLYPKQNGIFLACCGDKKCFNPVLQHCCGNEIYPRLNINTACCNGRVKSLVYSVSGIKRNTLSNR